MKQLFAIFTLMLVVSSLSFAQSSAAGSVDVNVARAASITYNDGPRTAIWVVVGQTKPTGFFNFTITGEATATIDVAWTASGSGSGWSFVETAANKDVGAGMVAATTPFNGQFPGAAPGAAGTIGLQVSYNVTGVTASGSGTLTVTGSISNYSI